MALGSKIGPKKRRRDFILQMVSKLLRNGMHITYVPQETAMVMLSEQKAVTSERHGSPNLSPAVRGTRYDHTVYG
jgi:hypothetical protein